MAEKEKKSNSNVINSLGKAIRTSLDALYTSTYYASPKNKRDLENIKNDINRSIANITASNTINTGMPNISSLYNKLMELTKDPQTAKKMGELFDNEDLMGQLTDVVFQNQSLVELDREIDTICKYMPKLVEALDTRKDNVLSADHFSKEFLNIKDRGNSVIDEATFFARIVELKTKYQLEEKVETWYDTASKYGEQFVYCVPYSKAFEKLLKNKERISQTAYIRQEHGQIVTESGDSFTMSKPDASVGDSKMPEIKLELNFSGVIEQAVLEAKKANEKAAIISESSVYKAFQEAMGEEDLPPEERNKKSFDKTIDDELDFSGFDDTSSDGLFSPTRERDTSKLKLITRGCVIKTLERSHVVPIYIEDLCLGYYYFEFADKDPRDPLNSTLTKGTTGSIPGLTNSTSTNSMLSSEPDTMKQDNLLRYIAGNMSQFIDSKFINANQDISKEIYMILKYNDLYNSGQPIKVSFIPPEDMTHIYWKKDKKTHHGVSDLERAFIPAILYVSLYLTLAIAQMTRGQDKRVYYVKQQVETNISKTLLNTIEQIKKGNFGVRQVQSINTMLNIVGRFNDYVIPVSASGDAPVQMEVMQGQQIDTKPDFLRELEEMAVNSTDIPIELIQARQSIDYAVQLTMTNSKFLRKVYNRQARYEEFLNPLISKIYNIEYNANSNIEVTLQPPLFLNITNTNQIITNTNEFVEAISNIVLADETDENVKLIANKKLKIYYMSSYFNMGVISRIIEESKQEATKLAVKSGNSEE